MELITPDLGLIFWTFHSVLAVLALIHLLSVKGKSIKLKLAWALAIIFIPLAGSFLYLIRIFRVKTN